MERQTIQSKIYEIRGRRVMLDFDLAMLYQVDTSALKRAVRRNIERFPDDFMFELSLDEYNDLKIRLRCQTGILETEDGRGRYPKYPPFAFTEQGVSMLSAVLRSSTAIQVSLSIMRAFVALRRLAMDSLEIKQLAMENKDIRRLLEEYIEETEEKFDEVYAALTELAEHRKSNPPKPRNPIGYVK